MVRIQSVVLAVALLVAGLVIGAALGDAPAQGQASERWHSCIAADIDKVNGNNPREMTEAGGEHRIMVPPGYVPIGGGIGLNPNGGDTSVVILCRR